MGRDGRKGSTRGSNRNESLFGNKTGRRIENDPLGPTLSYKIVLMGMMANDILSINGL